MSSEFLTKRPDKLMFSVVSGYLFWNSDVYDALLDIVITTRGSAGMHNPGNISYSAMSAVNKREMFIMLFIPRFGILI